MMIRLGGKFCALPNESASVVHAFFGTEHLWPNRSYVHVPSACFGAEHPCQNRNNVHAQIATTSMFPVHILRPIIDARAGRRSSRMNVHEHPCLSRNNVRVPNAYLGAEHPWQSRNNIHGAKFHSSFAFLRFTHFRYEDFIGTITTADRVGVQLRGHAATRGLTENGLHPEGSAKE